MKVIIYFYGDDSPMRGETPDPLEFVYSESPWLQIITGDENGHYRSFVKTKDIHSIQFDEDDFLEFLSKKETQ